MQTTMATSDALRKTVWEETLFRDTVFGSYFMGRMSGQSVKNLENGFPTENTPDDIIQIKEDLAAKGKTSTRPGDKITFGLVPRISPKTYRGVTSGQKLKGKEVALTWYDFSVELERYRQAISAGGPMDWQRASFNIPTEARNALLNWGIDLIDLLCVEALAASPTTVIYSDNDVNTVGTSFATAKAGIHDAATDNLTPDLVSYAAAWAKTGGGRVSGQVPLRPVKVNGENYYVLVVHPDCLFDWKNHSTVVSANTYAQERGIDNPLFKNAAFIWDNVLIHGYEGCPIGTDGAGASVPYAQCFLLGSQSLVWAWGERPSIVEDTDDYEEEFYNAWRMTAKAAKPKFNSKDYGSLSLVVRRTGITTAT